MSSSSSNWLEGVDWINPIVNYHEFFLAGQSPSSKEGISLEEELQCRRITCHVVQRAGRLLKMYDRFLPYSNIFRPQAGIMTAQILVHQFYCQRSVRAFPPLDVAMACVLIAGKVEECCRRVRDVVNIFYWLYQTIRAQKSIRMMEYISEEYYAWRDRVTRMEMFILRELGFHVQPRHPIGLLANYLNALELSDDPRLGQRAVNYTNDALRSITYVCWQPAVIACAAIRLAAADLDVVLPKNEWYSVFDVQCDELEGCEKVIQTVYSFDYTIDMLILPNDVASKEHDHGPQLLEQRERLQSRSRSRTRDHRSARRSRSRDRQSQDYRSGDRHDHQSRDDRDYRDRYRSRYDKERSQSRYHSHRYY